MGFATPVIQRLGNRDCTVSTYGAETKFCYPTGAGSFSVQKNETDSVGVFALTLTNLVVGSRIHIETEVGGSTLHDSVADATSKTISLSAYAPGSPYNALRIKVRKGTGSPTYKPFETLATAIVGAQSIYVGQIPDE